MVFDAPCGLRSCAALHLFAVGLVLLVWVSMGSWPPLLVPHGPLLLRLLPACSVVSFCAAASLVFNVRWMPWRFVILSADSCLPLGESFQDTTVF